MPQSESESQLVSRKNDVAVAGGAMDASTSAGRPLSPSDRRLPDVAVLMLRRCIYTPYVAQAILSYDRGCETCL